MTDPQFELSIVVPIYNEEACLPDVLHELRDALEAGPIHSWEAIVVDDGSVDRSAELIARLAGEDPRFRLIRFICNFGQTSAFDAGFRHARGQIVGMMDGDGQNDPRDFPRLLQALHQSKVDMVCGVRQNRKDTLIRRLSSRIANGVRNWMTDETVTDVGCSIRVFRRECIDHIKLFDGMHRFFPTLFRMEGYGISEIPVNHRPRTRGHSKYGINNRLWRGLRDLFAVHWMQMRTLRYQIMKNDDSD